MAAILLIEDDTDIQLAAQEVLQSEGYEVICACNGEEGLDSLLKTIQHLIPQTP